MEERQKNILHATVSHYISTAEPVGSQVLAEQYGLSWSSATLRNELNRLEQEGFLTHVHTSSGRVPTDKGYRSYVNSLDTTEVSPQQLKHDIQLIGQNIQDVLGQLSEMMSSLIDYTTIVLTPDIYIEALKVAHLVLVDLDKVLVVLLHAAGVNSEFLVKIEDKINQEDLNKISKLLTHKLEGKSFYTLDPQFITGLQDELPRLAPVLKELCVAIRQLSKSHTENRKLYSKGMSNMLKLPEFRNIELTQKVLSTLEENKVLAGVLSEYLADPHCHVVIGAENKIESLKECSLVMAPFSIEGEPVGMIGILGPRRMSYPVVVPMMQVVTEKINAYLNRYDQGGPI